MEPAHPDGDLLTPGPGNGSGRSPLGPVDPRTRQGDPDPSVATEGDGKAPGKATVPRRDPDPSVATEGARRETRQAGKTATGST